MTRTWCLTDLVLGRDGKLVMTKVQATTFHLAIFLTVVFITIIKRDFIFEMWSLYAAVAVGHAVLDKTGAQVTEFKTKKLAAETSGAKNATNT